MVIVIFAVTGCRTTGSGTDVKQNLLGIAGIVASRPVAYPVDVVIMDLETNGAGRSGRKQSRLSLEGVTEAMSEAGAKGVTARDFHWLAEARGDSVVFVLTASEEEERFLNQLGLEMELAAEKGSGGQTVKMYRLYPVTQP